MTSGGEDDAAQKGDAQDELCRRHPTHGPLRSGQVGIRQNGCLHRCHLCEGVPGWYSSEKLLPARRRRKEGDGTHPHRLAEHEAFLNSQTTSPKRISAFSRLLLLLKYGPLSAVPGARDATDRPHQERHPARRRKIHRPTAQKTPELPSRARRP